MFYSIWTIICHKIVNYNIYIYIYIYIGIVIATITFYDIDYAIYGIRQSIKNNNKQIHLLMLVNLATALISLELIQSALLSLSQDSVDNSLYNGII